MLSMIKSWYKLHFSDPQAITLLFILLGGFLLLYFASSLLAPILLALVLAYLLEWPVDKMTRVGLPRAAAASIVLLGFVLVMMVITFGLIPSLWNQGLSLASDLPNMIDSGYRSIEELAQEYPQYISMTHVDAIMKEVQSMADSQQVLKVLKGLAGVSAEALVLMVYAILVPLLVFFFLKDKESLIKDVTRFFPNNRELANKVWTEMDVQIFNYIRGKIMEIIIIGVVSYIFFAMMGLRYSVLLGVLTGLSVLVPYVGATLVTIPIALVGFFQWGVSPEFGYLMLGYGIIQALDGNVLVPILFSGAVNLHPVMIIAAVLVFGGLWGVWGVFFAIPLASLVRAVVNAWPSVERPPTEMKAAE
ncbi:AI-2E family transporter [Paraferrimonas haliotis]|uniref:AI-2E family transporter n=1 Tax=Paraferrimonas haliotis TaxID=2013866 RepID=A0AA37TRF1_9GAMM|nr:AI-2E family transporter [Paraferrimonas haliotis]GLS84278.1 AI-2E family transporter [Paraferrimonas haliotis]